MRHDVDTGPRFSRRSTDRPKDYDRSMDLIVAFVLAVAIVLLAGWLGAP
jgi:hypothetical protein